MLNGTGAHQWRFVVAFDAAASAFVVDRPLDAAPQRGALVAIVACKARLLHHRNRWSDVGAVQLYEAAVDVIASENVGERFGGFKSWGHLHAPSAFIGPEYFSTPNLQVRRARVPRATPRYSRSGQAARSP